MKTCVYYVKNIFDIQHYYQIIGVYLNIVVVIQYIVLDNTSKLLFIKYIQRLKLMALCKFTKFFNYLFTKSLLMDKLVFTQNNGFHNTILFYQ